MNITERKLPYLEKAKSLSNRNLFAETFTLAQGDEWDGAFTKEGLDEYNAYMDILEIRLAEWLSEKEVTYV